MATFAQNLKLVKAVAFLQDGPGIEFRYTTLETDVLSAGRVLKLRSLGGSWCAVHCAPGPIYRTYLTSDQCGKLQELLDRVERPPVVAGTLPAVTARIQGPAADDTDLKDAALRSGSTRGPVPSGASDDVLPHAGSTESVRSPWAPIGRNLWKMVPGTPAIAAPAQDRVLPEDAGAERTASRAERPPLYGAPRGWEAYHSYWCGPDAPIHVHGWTIAEPFGYFSYGPPEPAEPSCVDLRLEALESTDRIQYRHNLCYRTMSRRDRGAYLTWLAAGRPVTVNEGGFRTYEVDPKAWVFVRGLERRALGDRQDTDRICRELARFIPEPRVGAGEGATTLARTALSLLLYLLARDGVKEVPDSWVEWALRHGPLGFGGVPRRFALGVLAARGDRLPDGIVRSLVETPERRRVVLSTMPAEWMDHLFAEEYAAQFPNGIRLQQIGRESVLRYQPVNESVRGEITCEAVAYPEAGLSDDDTRMLEMVWQRCMRALEQPIQRLRRAGRADDPAVYEALPPGLQGRLPNPERPRWQALYEAHRGDDEVAFVPLSRVAALRGFPAMTEVRPAMLEEWERAAERAGFELELEPVGRRRSVEDVAALFPMPSGGTRRSFDGLLGAAYLILTAFRAAHGVTGPIAGTAAEVGLAFVLEACRPNEADARRLQARARVPSSAPALSCWNRLTYLVARNVAFPRERLPELLALLSRVAAAAEGSPRPKLNTLRKVCEALGLSADEVHPLLQPLEERVEAAARLRRGDRAAFGELLPLTLPPMPAEVVLDADRVQAILQETREVASLLTEALAEVEGALEVPHLEPAVPREERVERSEKGVPSPYSFLTPPHSLLAAADARFEGLPERYHAVLGVLTTRETWAAGDYARIVRDHSLFPSGLLDVVNEWAEERLGDWLLEDGDPVVVYRDRLGA